MAPIIDCNTCRFYVPGEMPGVCMDCVIAAAHGSEELPNYQPKTEAPMSTQHDPVSHPAHYTQGNIEVIDFITDQKMNYLEGNIIKYVSRYKFKNGIEDLRKARFYLDALVEYYANTNAEDTNGN